MQAAVFSLVFFNVLRRRVDVSGKHEQAVCSLLDFKFNLAITLPGAHMKVKTRLS